MLESFPGRRWGFPKGKKNNNESMQECAVREVFEETGYDITNKITPDEYLELAYEDMFVQLFIVHGISRKTIFQPQTKGEVKVCQQELKSRHAIFLSCNMIKTEVLQYLVDRLCCSHLNGCLSKTYPVPRGLRMPIRNLKARAFTWSGHLWSKSINQSIEWSSNRTIQLFHTTVFHSDFSDNSSLNIFLVKSVST